MRKENKTLLEMGSSLHFMMSLINQSLKVKAVGWATKED